MYTVVPCIFLSWSSFSVVKRNKLELLVSEYRNRMVVYHVRKKVAPYHLLKTGKKQKVKFGPFSTLTVLDWICITIYSLSPLPFVVNRRGNSILSLGTKHAEICSFFHLSILMQFQEASLLKSCCPFYHLLSDLQLPLLHPTAKVLFTFLLHFLVTFLPFSVRNLWTRVKITDRMYTYHVSNISRVSWQIQVSKNMEWSLHYNLSFVLLQQPTELQLRVTWVPWLLPLFSPSSLLLSSFSLVFLLPSFPPKFSLCSLLITLPPSLSLTQSIPALHPFCLSIHYV